MLSEHLSIASNPLDGVIYHLDNVHGRYKAQNIWLILIHLIVIYPLDKVLTYL